MSPERIRVRCVRFRCCPYKEECDHQEYHFPIQVYPDTIIGMLCTEKSECFGIHTPVRCEEII